MLRDRLRRVALALIGFGCAVPAVTAAGQARVVVRQAGADTLVLAAAARANVVFRVSSGSAAVEKLRIRARAPDGWRVNDPPDLELLPDSAALRVVSVAVPANTAPGVYVLSLMAVDAAGAAVEGSVRIRVPAQMRLGVRVIDPPGAVLPGSSYRVRFAISNRGNQPVLPALEVVASGGARVLAQPVSPFLEPGAEALVNVAVRSPPAVRTAAHAVRITAVAANDTARGSVRVQVEAGDVAAARHGIPGHLRFRVSDDGGTAAGVRLQLSGPVRPASQTGLDMLLQRPPRQFGLLGEREVYRAALNTPHGSVRVGDHFFALSQLTEPGREGAGASATARAGPLTAGGYMQRSRHTPDPLTQQAAFGRVRIAAPVTLGVNWLRSERAGRAGRATHTGGVESRFRLLNGVSGDGEYVLGAGTAARGHSIDVRLDRRSVAARVRHLRSDITLGTPTAGTRIDAIQLTLRPAQRVRVDGWLEGTGSSRMQAGQLQHREQQSGRVSLAWEGVGSLELRQTATSGAFGSYAYDRQSSSARVRVRLPLGLLILTPGLEAGAFVNNARREEGTFWRADAQGRLTAGWASLSGGLEYHTGGTLHNAAAADGIAGSFSATLFPRGSTRMTVTAGRAAYYGDLERVTTHASANLERDLPGGHRLGMRAIVREWTGSHRAHQQLLALDYALPLRIPVAPAAPSATVSGRVYDGETGAPLQGVLIEIGGRRATTNARGMYEIRGVAGTPHAFNVDRWSAGLERVPSDPLPTSLTPRAGSTTTLDIALVRSAAVSARAVLVRPGGGAQDLPATVLPLGGVVIELERNGERVRRVLDDSGRILIEDLRPGRWAVSASSATLPPFHRFEPDTLWLLLAPGGRDSLELRVVPVERRMHMIDIGSPTLTLEQPASKPGTGPSPGIRPSSGTGPSPGTGSSPGTGPSPGTARAPLRAEPDLRAAAAATAGPPAASPTPRPKAPPARSPTPRPRAPPATARATAGTALPPGWTRVTVPAHNASLRGIAREHYRETGLWPKIWLANRRVVTDPDQIPAGTVLLLPPQAPLTAEEESALHQYMQRRLR
jgi:hypothetical protein